MPDCEIASDVVASYGEQSYVREHLRTTLIRTRSTGHKESADREDRQGERIEQQTQCGIDLGLVQSC